MSIVTDLILQVILSNLGLLRTKLTEWVVAFEASAAETATKLDDAVVAALKAVVASDEAWAKLTDAIRDLFGVAARSTDASTAARLKNFTLAELDEATAIIAADIAKELCAGRVASGPKLTIDWTVLVPILTQIVQFLLSLLLKPTPAPTPEPSPPINS